MRAWPILRWFPATCAAAHALFVEALADLPPDAVIVVGLETDQIGVEALKARYREALGPIPDDASSSTALKLAQGLSTPVPQPGP